MSSLRTVSARGLAVTSSGQLLKFVIQIATVAVLSRLIAPEHIGLMAMVVVVSGASELLREAGVCLAVVQAPQISDQQRSNVFWINCLVGALLTALVYGAAGPVAAFFDQPDLVDPLRAVSPVFLLNAAAAVFRGGLARDMRFHALAWSDVMAQATGLAVAVGLALAGHGLAALVGQQLSMTAAALVTAVVFSRWRPGLPSRTRGPVRALLSFGAASSATQALNYVTASLDNLLVGKFWGPVPLALYSRAYVLFGTPLAQIGSPATRLAVSVLSSARADVARYRRYVEAMQRLMLLLAVPVLGLVFALADPLVAIALGPQWTGVPPLLRLLVPGGLFQVVNFSYYWVFLTEGRVGLHLRYSIVGRVLMVLCLLAAAPFGVEQVAAAASLGSALTWLTYALFAMPRTTIGRGGLGRLAGTPLVLGAGVTFAAGAASRTVPTDQAVLEVLAGLVAAVAVTALAYAVSSTVRHDSALLGQVVASLRHRRPAAPCATMTRRAPQDAARDAVVHDGRDDGRDDSGNGKEHGC